MVDAIQEIGAIGWQNSILSFVLIICIIIAGVSGYYKLIDSLGLRSKSSLEKEKMKEDMAHMQKQIDALDKKIKTSQSTVIDAQEHYHQQSIEIRNKLADGQSDLKGDIQSLTELLQTFMDRENQNTIAMFRSSLWRMHKDYMSQGYVTPDALKTFTEMGKLYEMAGGNDIYHDKLLPDIQHLPIHHPDGSIYEP